MKMIIAVILGASLINPVVSIAGDNRASKADKITKVDTKGKFWPSLKTAIVIGWICTDINPRRALECSHREVKKRIK